MSRTPGKKNLVFEKDSFELLQDILEGAGELEKRVDYEQLVTTEFAKCSHKTNLYNSLQMPIDNKEV